MGASASLAPPDGRLEGLHHPHREGCWPLQTLRFRLAAELMSKSVEQL